MKKNWKETLKLWLGALLIPFAVVAEAVSTGCKKLRTLPKKVMAVCVAAALLVAMVPAYVFAAETTYDLWVGGVQVTSANKDDIVKAINDAANATVATGTATYDPESETLTLNGFSYTGQGYVYDSPWCAAIFAENDLTVKVVGSNTVTASVTNPYTAEALYVGGALTITGDSGSSLSLTGAGINGVDCGGNLKIEDVTVNATGTSGLCSWEGNITINNATVYATATGSGIYEGAIIALEKNITIENSKVTATAISGYAININGTDWNTCTIKNGEVTISNAECGMRLATYANLNVENSTLTITATDKAIDALGLNDILVDNHVVYAGNDAASATAADATLVATYENKYVKIEPVKYDLWVAGVQLTGTNLVIDSTDSAAISGTATYDPDSKTLTLNNFSYTGEGYLTDFKVGGSYFSAAIFSDFSLTVLLEGDSVITHVNASYYGSSCGIASSKDLIVGDAPADGVGTLTVTADTYCYTSAALYAFNNLTITGGVINATADEALDSSSAILSNFGNLTVSGGEVTALSQYSEYYSFGLVAYGKIIVSDATVKATSGDAEELSAGIYTFSAGVEISNSNVEATGGEVGICSCYDVTISDSTVTAEGTEIGIYAYSGYITISGEKTSVTATGADCGIHVYDGNLTVSDSTVKATATGEDGNGIYAYGDLTINGGTVKATATGEYGIAIVANTVIVNNGTVEAISTGESGYGMTFYDAPTLNGTLAVYAGEDAATAVRVAAPTSSTYQNKYIKIAVPYYDVVIDYGINGIDNKVITILEGDTVSLDNPLFDGYVFMGWFADEVFTAAFDFTAPITADTTIYAKFADYEGDKTELNNKIDAAKAELQAKIDTVNSALAGKADADALAQAIADLNTAKTNIQNLLEQIDDYEDADTVLKAELITKIEAADNHIHTAISDLTSRVQTLESELAAATSDISTNASEIAELTADLAALNTSLTDLSNKLTNDYATKAELTNAINSAKATINSTIDALTIRVQNLEAGLAAADSKIDTNTSDVGTLKRDVAVLKTWKTEAQDAINALKTLTGTQGTDIANLKSAVQSLEAELAAAKARIDDIENKIAVLEGRVSALETAEQELEAAVAALNAAIANKADTATLNQKVGELNDAIIKAEATAKEYTDGVVKNLRAAIIAAKDEAVNVAKDLVDAAKAELQAAIDNNKADITAVNTAIANLQNSITALQNAKDNYIAADAALKDELEDAIAEAKQEAIDAAKGYIPYIGTNGNWWIGTADTGVDANGIKGDKGDPGAMGENGVGIAKIEKTSSDGNVDTYTITLTDGTTYTFTVTNGTNGTDGKDGVDGKDGTNGTNGVDGKDGADGEDGQTPYIGENGNWWIGDTDTGVKAAGDDGKDGAVIAATAVGGTALVSNIALLAWTLIKKKRLF